MIQALVVRGEKSRPPAGWPPSAGPDADSVRSTASDASRYDPSAFIESNRLIDLLSGLRDSEQPHTSAQAVLNGCQG